MYTTLPKNHEYRVMVGAKKVNVKDKECLNLQCFRPHDFSYTRTDRKVIHDWRCVHRENHGCPDVKLVKEY